MAKTTVTHVTDDIDGTPDAQTVTFGFQGVAYSIDLGQRNLDRLAKSLAPFIDHATRQRGGAAPVRRSASTANRAYDLAAFREWAAKNKVDVPRHGRIPSAVVEQYRAAGGR